MKVEIEMERYDAAPTRASCLRGDRRQSRACPTLTRPLAAGQLQNTGQSRQPGRVERRRKLSFQLIYDSRRLFSTRRFRRLAAN